MAHASAPAAPAGKTARDENFPVASRLLPARLRPCLLAFYAFARYADDIADDPGLSPEQKLARLDRLAAGLDGTAPGPPPAAALRTALAAADAAPDQALALLAAFRHDALHSRCPDWAALIAYCRLSAVPVGRFLLDLHGESAAARPAADALCAALQVLNHLQDCRADHRDLSRVYLPLDWLAAEGATVTMLAAPVAAPPLRRVLDRMLDGVDQLLAAAHPLPARLRQRGLRLEAAVILAIARRLAAKLRHQDPLARRVALSRPEYLACALRGLIGGALGR